MNLNQVFRMAQRLFLRRLINKGINAGIGFASRRGKSASEMTPGDRDMANKGKHVAKNARRMARMGRRMGRF
jgi:hypothetical protein